MTFNLHAPVWIAVIGTAAATGCAPSAETPRGQPAAPPATPERSATITPTAPAPAPPSPHRAPLPSWRDFMPGYFAGEPRDAAWAYAEEELLRAAMLREGFDVRKVECKTTLCALTLGFSDAASMQRYLDHSFSDPDVIHGRGLTEVFDEAKLEGVGYMTRVGCQAPNRRTGERGKCGAERGSGDPIVRQRNGLPPQ